MSLTRAKPIGQLYDEVAGYDTVLVPDRPYARAINRHLERAHVGHFATTPRQLVAGDRDGRDDRIAFLELIQTVDLSWKQTAHLIGEVLQCWEHQGTPEAILEYDRYDTPAVRTVVQEITSIDTRARRLQDTRLDGEGSVAVIGYDQLTALQRSILPPDVTRIDPFLDGATERPSFQLVESPSAMLAQIVETIRANDPADIAVVFDENSRYSTLVESAFDAAAIPYHGGPGFTDEPDHRALLRLLRLSHAGRALTVSDVRPVLARLGKTLPITDDNKHLASLQSPAARWIERTLREIPAGTIAEAIDTFEAATGVSVDDFTDQMDTLGVLDASANRETVDRITFYVQAYDIPIDREDSGVALASATSAAYVDRPLVFFLGLDQGWTREAPPRPWVDADQFFARDLSRFQLLLQSGAKQQYLVQDIAGGEPVVPCLYLNSIIDESFDRFRDLTDDDVLRPLWRGSDGFDIDPTPVPASSYTTISQTALNTFVHSPRDYAFGSLVGSPEAVPLEEGSLLHDFAEFAVANPAFIDEDVIEQAATSMVEEMASFFSAEERELRHSAYYAYLTVLATFIESRPPRDLSATIGERSTGPNHFAELFDRPVETERTERSFETPELGMKGTIDLVHSDTHLIDFKRGTRKTPGAIVRNAAIDPPDDTPDFQTPQYLSYLRHRLPDRHLRFTFLYLRELADDALAGELDLAEGLETIEYHPVSFAEFVASDDAHRTLVEESFNASQKTFEQVPFEAYRQFWDEQPASAFEGELDEEPLRTELETELIALVGDYTYVTKGTGQALRYLDDINNTSFFKGDLDAFETFVQDRLAELNRYLAGDERFPKRGQVEELNDRRLNHPDLLLDHD